ncbi:hypothetical protein Cs7R123_08900 [Catellatospora sp. TT07R-123]|uniref:RICIN domain-containing protein n=1 Tax=Catellatospora sp. TT07R-123 TaxID=2733863 RepID=UPI001B02C083|nr:RICIN domain-containing protein [Catellatospora sp. TT07R-123]GHJ43548.1 hypothetical protein Cs7R123_08900 [Catellatospora sp. TT07R-123]
MRSLRLHLGRTAVGVGTALALTALWASPAAAVPFVGQDVPTTAVIAPGDTGPVRFTYQNTGGEGLFPASGTSVQFTAPGNTTFAPQSTMPGQYSANGTDWISNNLSLRNCALSNNATTLTCEAFSISGGYSNWPSGTFFRFAPMVTVSPNAPSGTTLSPRGTATLTYNDINTRNTHTISDGTLTVATPAPPAARAGMCLDVGNSRNNGDNVRIWQCLNHTNQRFEIEGGRIKVADTVGTGAEMCMDAAARNNGANVFIWRCTAGNTNQQWVVRNGYLVLKDTIGSSAEMCLDIGNTRNNGDNARLWQCMNHTNQRFVIQRGYIKVEDTL